MSEDVFGGWTRTPPHERVAGVAARRHHRCDVDLDSVFRKDGRLYTVVGIADDPTIRIRDVVSGKVESHVIGCLNFAEFEHLRRMG